MTLKRSPRLQRQDAPARGHQAVTTLFLGDGGRGWCETPICRGGVRKCDVRAGPRSSCGPSPARSGPSAGRGSSTSSRRGPGRRSSPRRGASGSRRQYLSPSRSRGRWPCSRPRTSCTCCRRPWCFWGVKGAAGPQFYPEYRIGAAGFEEANLARWPLAPRRAAAAALVTIYPLVLAQYQLSGLAP